eukprot:8984436-Lingulodinium_polyedra.AAC.1
MPPRLERPTTSLFPLSLQLKQLSSLSGTSTSNSRISGTVEDQRPTGCVGFHQSKMRQDVVDKEDIVPMNYACR